MSELWWVSVGGNDCEPARIEGDVAYTIGCSDSMPLTRFVKVSKITNKPMRPRTKEEQVVFENWLAEENKAGRRHGYRKWK